MGGGCVLLQFGATFDPIIRLVIIGDCSTLPVIPGLRVYTADL